MAFTRCREPFAPRNDDAGGNMRRAIFVALGTGAFITGAAAISIAGAGSAVQSISLEQYESARQALDAGRERAIARCDAQSTAERELCRSEAGAVHRVRAAEVEQQFRRTHQSARELQRARIDARYQVERTRCAMLGGFKRDKCLVQAHATRGRAMLDAAAPYEARF
jgi:hypothetical protein